MRIITHTVRALALIAVLTTTASPALADDPAVAEKVRYLSGINALDRHGMCGSLLLAVARMMEDNPRLRSKYEDHAARHIGKAKALHSDHGKLEKDMRETYRTVLRQVRNGSMDIDQALNLTIACTKV